MSKNSITNYLKALYTEEAWKGAVTTGALARRLDVSAATASTMLKRLEQEGVVRRLERGKVGLTGKGRASAARIVRKHRLVETFLYQVLGYPLDQLHAEAAALEAAISDTLEQRIDDYLGHPDRDPHGHPIPPARGRDREFSRMARSRCGSRSGENERCLVRLDSVAEGSSVLVAEVDDEDAEAVSRLVSLGIVPGRHFRMNHVEPFGGPMWIEGDKGVVPVARGLAEKVRVDVVFDGRANKRDRAAPHSPRARKGTRSK